MTMRIRTLSWAAVAASFLLSTTAAAQFSDFDAEFYLSRYADLQEAFGSNYQLAEEHWQPGGKTEMRQAALEFDAAYYMERYPDLEASFGANYQALLAHFLNYGISEGRRASRQFDIAFYVSHYPDLQASFGDDYRAAFTHWLVYGKWEGRLTAQEVACVPSVHQVAVAAAPTPPAGMKVTCLSTSCPVVRCGTAETWAFSYFDNRNSLGVVTYDAGAVVRQGEAVGARYVDYIDLDASAQNATLYGQANYSVVIPWSDLRLP